MSAKHRSHGWRMLRLKIDGMHCANCEVLIERRFKKITGVRRVKVSSTTGMAEVNCYGDVDIATLQRAIAEDGYTVWLLHEQTNKPTDSGKVKNTRRDYVEIGAVFLVLVGLYVVLSELNILPERLAVPNTISYGLAFVIGVVASMSTCIAVTGGLLVAIAAKYNAVSGEVTGAQRFRPHLYFNAGRIVSYTTLGGATGALGSVLTLSPEVNG